MIHLLPACGKLSAGLAVLIRQMGFELSVYDSNPQYPMLKVLVDAGIEVQKILPEWESLSPEDTIIIGNSLSRGHPWIEAALSQQRRLWSMPEWLHEHVLSKRKVIAIAGTHGKTSVTAQLAWLLQELGEDVGYLIGGVATDLPSSAYLGSSAWFVIEADEYDTAWFDKRAKFFWYWPNIAVVNHVEYDHPDIYINEENMMHAYRMWLRMLPQEGLACVSKRVDALHLLHPLGGKKVVFDEHVCFEHHDLTSWSYAFEGKEVLFQGQLSGYYHAENIWLTAKVAEQLGFDLVNSLHVLQFFTGVQRRMVHVHSIAGVACYDDFAHHPTALASVCQSFDAEKLHLVIYPSNAMWRQMETIGQMNWQIAKYIYVLDHPRLNDAVREALVKYAHLHNSYVTLIQDLAAYVRVGDVVLTCSSDDMTMIHKGFLEEMGKRLHES